MFITVVSKFYSLFCIQFFDSSAMTFKKILKNPDIQFSQRSKKGTELVIQKQAIVMYDRLRKKYQESLNLIEIYKNRL